MVLFNKIIEFFDNNKKKNLKYMIIYHILF